MERSDFYWTEVSFIGQKWLFFFLKQNCLFHQNSWTEMSLSLFVFVVFLHSVNLVFLMQLFFLYLRKMWYLYTTVLRTTRFSASAGTGWITLKLLISYWLCSKCAFSLFYFSANWLMFQLIAFHVISSVLNHNFQTMEFRWYFYNLSWFIVSAHHQAF